MTEEEQTEDLEFEEPTSSSSHKKKKKKHRHEKGKHKKGKGEESEEEDEEGEESENDHYEVDGFVVGDDEGDEMEEGKEEGDEERRRKRRKKRKGHQKLDEDDLRLLADSGVAVSVPKKHKRLFRRNDSEEVAPEDVQRRVQDELFGQDDERDALDELDEEKEALNDMQQGEEDEMSEGEDSDDLDDFIVDTDENGQVIKRKKQKRRPHRMHSASSSQMREVADIFGLGYDEFLNEDEFAPKISQKNKLEEQFEPSVLSERYITPQDDLIRSIDIPERLQSRYYNQEKATTIELTNEAQWIYPQLFPLNEGSQMDKKLLARMINVLEFLRNDHYEVPYIYHYCADYISSASRSSSSSASSTYGGENSQMDLTMGDLWNIYELDEKWMHFKSRKGLLEQMKNSVEVDVNYSNLIEECQTDVELQDLVDYFQLHVGEEENKEEEGTRHGNKPRRAIRRDHYRLCKRAGITKFIQHFGLSANELGENMINGTLTHSPSDPDSSPLELATHFPCGDEFTSKKKEARGEEILKAARSAAAQEIAFNPHVRSSLRSFYNERAVVSTTPTEKGKGMDAFHPMRGLIRLHQKPAKLLMSYQWLELVKGEKDGFLTIKVELPSNESTSDLQVVSRDLEKLYLSDGTSFISQEWNNQRKLILQESLEKHLLPLLEKELRQKLYEESSKGVMDLCATKLTRRLMAGPFRPPTSDSVDGMEEEIKVMACCYGTGDTPTMCIMLDAEGEPVTFLKLNFITMIRDTRRKDELIKLQDFIIEHEPHVIAIAADAESKRLYDEMEAVTAQLFTERKILEKIHVTFVDVEVARIFQSSHRANAELPDYPIISRRAVSIGRLLQDPLSELSALVANDSKEILYLKLHPLQNLVNKEKLLETLIQCFLSVVNRTGVDINRAVQHKFAAASLQFVCGLGPRKVVGILNTISRKGGKISSREELDGMVGPCVYTNCAGFIRIRDKYFTNIENVLDDTRIHPNDYNLVRKMAKDSFEDNSVDSDLVEKLMKRPERLDDIDLDAFAEELEKNNKPKKKSILYNIKEEIHNPYKDMRESYRDPSPEELFTMLTGETEQSVKMGQLVSAKIVAVTDKIVRCQLDNGLSGIVRSANISDSASLEQLNLQEGMVLNARVMETQIRDPKNYSVDLSCKSSILRDISYEDNALNSLAVLDRYFLKEDYSQELSKSKPKKKKGFTPRKVNHPLFKNIGFPESERYLSNKNLPLGEVVIRPSSKGQNYLTLSIKFFQDIFLHITVREEKKANAQSLGKLLWLGTQKFEDVDEIVSNFVEPMMNNAQELFKFRVFRGSQGKEATERQLKEEKEAKPERIPYLVTASSTYPGKFVLSYLPSKSPRHEYVSVNDSGFKFRGETFKSPEKLIGWFKVHCNDPPKERVPEKSRINHPNNQTSSEMSALPSYSNPNYFPPQQQPQYNSNPPQQPWHRPQPNPPRYNNNHDYGNNRGRGREEQQDSTWMSGGWGNTNINPDTSAPISNPSQSQPWWGAQPVLQAPQSAQPSNSGWD